MQEPGNILAVAFAALMIGLPILGYVMYHIFWYSYRLAYHVRLSIPFGTVALCFCFLWIPVSMMAFLVPVSPFMRGAIFLAFYLFNVYPTLIGFATGRYYRQEADSKLYQRNVDEWLSEWECRDAEGIPQEEIDLLMHGPDIEPPREP